jgi:hypothetical protein
MAGQRLTDKGTFGTTPIANNDLLMGVDVSDSTGSSAGTSKSLKANRLITTVTSSLTSTAVSALNTTPLDIFNPGTGFIVIPLTVVVECTFVSAQETNGEALIIGYDKATTGATENWASYRDFYQNQSASATYVFGGSNAMAASGTYPGSLSGKFLQLWSGGSFGGDWTMKVYATVTVFPAI